MGRLLVWLMGSQSMRMGGWIDRFLNGVLMQVRVAMAAQELLACGEKWNQGCDGGFPFLASKYSPAPTVVVGPVTASPSTVGLPVLGSSLRLQAVCALVV